MHCNVRKSNDWIHVHVHKFRSMPRHALCNAKLTSREVDPTTYLRACRRCVSHVTAFAVIVPHVSLRFTCQWIFRHSPLCVTAFAVIAPHPRKPVHVLYTCQWCEFGIVYVWCIFTRVWNVFHRFHLVYNWCRVHQYHSCCCTHVIHTVFRCHFGVISLVVGIYYVWNGMCNTHVQSHVLYPCTLRVSYQPEVYFPCR